MENVTRLLEEKDSIDSIERFCDDFDYFCSYLMDNKIKLSKNTCQIGKKACYEINQKLRRSEKYEKAGHLQEGYMVIHFMYYIAFSYRILEMEPEKGYVVQGYRYHAYKRASSIEKYLLFFTNYLYNRTCWRHCEFSYVYAMREFFVWIKENYKKEQSYRVPASIFEMYLNPAKSTLPMLEELGLVQLEECIEDKRCIRECKIKIFPLANLLAKMYDEAAVDREKLFGTEGEIPNYLKEYLCYLAPDKDTRFFTQLYEEVYTDVKKPEQIIRIDVAMRYHKCSRELLLSSKNTLEDLHLLIQEAFEFDNDHLYEFYVGKGMFRKSYCIDEAVTSGEELSAEDTCLEELPIHKGFAFEYLFDFGDCWWFDLKVRECKEGQLKKPSITKINGKAPEQYHYGW